MKIYFVGTNYFGGTDELAAYKSNYLFIIGIPVHLFLSFFSQNWSYCLKKSIIMLATFYFVYRISKRHVMH